MIALSVVLVCGAFMVALPVALMLIEPVPLPMIGPVPLPATLPSQNQTSETLLYILTFFLLLPAAIWSSLLAGRRITRLSGPGAFSSLAGLLVIGLGISVLLARLLPEWTEIGNRGSTFLFGVVWLLLAAAVLGLAMSGRSGKADAGLARSGRLIWQAAALAAVGGVFALVGWDEVDPGALAAGLVAGALTVLLFNRLRPREIGRWGLAFDLAMVVLIMLAIPDLVILRPEEALSDPVAAFDTSVIQFHQNLFLGAASQVLSGSALLVDTVSQYGVGSIYLIAAFFKVAPIGHGTIGFFDAVLSAAVFAGGYGVLRMSGVNRLLSAASLALAVTILIYGLYYPVGGLLQHGAIRFGLPMPLIVFAVAGLRWPRGANAMHLLALAVVGLSSVWALEAFLYVVFTWFGLTAISLVWQAPGSRARWLFRQALSVAAAIVVVQGLFAAITLAASGSLPDWGLYFTYLREFLVGDIGDLTYDFDPWSPGLAVAAIYIAGAAALAVTAIRDREFVRRRRTAFLALGGLTGYGIVLFSYFDNRSLDHILPYVSLPALLVSTIWLALILDRPTGTSGRAMNWALGLALLASALAVANVWPAAGNRFQDSVLAAATPGGSSLRGGINRLWQMPPVVPGSDEGRRLIETYMPGEQQTAVLVAPDLDLDILVRSGRSNSLTITDAKEASWVTGPHLPGVEQAVADLEPGDRILVDEGALLAAAKLRREPDLDRFDLAGQVGLATIQVEAIAMISERFDLNTVAGGSNGLTVVELEARG